MGMRADLATRSNNGWGSGVRQRRGHRPEVESAERGQGKLRDWCRWAARPLRAANSSQISRNGGAGPPTHPPVAQGGASMQKDEQRAQAHRADRGVTHTSGDGHQGDCRSTRNGKIQGVLKRAETCSQGHRPVSNSTKRRGPALEQHQDDWDPDEKRAEHLPEWGHRIGHPSAGSGRREVLTTLIHKLRPGSGDVESEGVGGASDGRGEGRTSV